MEENSEIDRLARKASELLKTNVPDSSWKRLEAELDKQQAMRYKKQTGRFRLLSICLALLLISFMFYHFLVPTSVVINVGDISGKKITALQVDHYDIHSKHSAPDLNTSTVSNDQSVHASPPNDVTKKDIGRGKSMNTEIKNHQVQNVQRQYVSKQNVPRKNAMLTQSTVSMPDKNSASPKKAQNENANIIHESSVTLKSETPAIGIAETGSDNSILITEPGAEVSEGDGHGTALNQMQIDPGRNEKITDITSTVTVPADQDTSATAESKKGLMQKLFAEAFYSPEHSWIHLRDVSDDNKGIQEYYDREKFISAFTAGANVGYSLHQKIDVATGFHYSERKYSMTYPEIYVGKGFDGDLHYQYPTSWGIVEKPNTGNRVLHDGDTLQKTISCTQSIKIISIPLMIRYRLGGKKLQMYCSAGMSANFINHAIMNLRIGNIEGMIERNIDGLKPLYFGYMVSIGFKYHLIGGFSVFAEPVFRGSLNSVVENIDIKSYPHSAGLNAGINFQPGSCK